MKVTDPYLTLAGGLTVAGVLDRGKTPVPPIKEL